MDDEQKRVKHLEMILGVVNRLAGNSFSMKGWSITLVSALFALAARDANLRYAALGLLPGLCFWGLDSYYLRQERLYRKLYDAVRREPVESSPIASPPESIEPFSMNVASFAPHVQSWARTLFSKSIFWLHAPIVAAVVAVIVYTARR